MQPIRRNGKMLLKIKKFSIRIILVYMMQTFDEYNVFFQILERNENTMRPSSITFARDRGTTADITCAFVFSGILEIERLWFLLCSRRNISLFQFNDFSHLYVYKRDFSYHSKVLGELAFKMADVSLSSKNCRPQIECDDKIDLSKN